MKCYKLDELPKSTRFFEKSIPGIYKYYDDGPEKDVKRKEHRVAVSVFAGSGTDESGQWFFKYSNGCIGKCRKQTHADSNVCNVKFDKTKIIYQDDAEAERIEYERTAKQLHMQEQQMHMLYDNAVSSSNPEIAQHARMLGYTKWKNEKLGTESAIIAVEADDNYYVSVSIAYVAKSIFDMQLKNEPWLHARRVMLQKFSGGKMLNSAVYWVAYVWDTREVVQWVEDKRTVSQRPDTKETSKRYVKAIDNHKPLKDPNHLVPGWAMKKLGKSSELYSMANEPEEVRNAFYNRY